MRCQPGQLKDRIEFHRSAIVGDGHGGKRQAYTLHKRAWARVIPLSSTEAMEAAAVTSKVTYKVVIRRRDDVLPTDVIKWRGSTLNIVAPLYPCVGQYLEIQCELGAAP